MWVWKQLENLTATKLSALPVATALWTCSAASCFLWSTRSAFRQQHVGSRLGGVNSASTVRQKGRELSSRVVHILSCNYLLFWGDNSRMVARASVLLGTPLNWSSPRFSQGSGLTADNWSWQEILEPTSSRIWFCSHGAAGQRQVTERPFSNEKRSFFACNNRICPWKCKRLRPLCLWGATQSSPNEHGHFTSGSWQGSSRTCRPPENSCWHPWASAAWAEWFTSPKSANPSKCFSVSGGCQWGSLRCHGRSQSFYFWTRPAHPIASECSARCRWTCIGDAKYCSECELKHWTWGKNCLTRWYGDPLGRSVKCRGS